MLSSFCMCMRNLRVFGIYNIPITTIKLNTIVQYFSYFYYIHLYINVKLLTLVLIIKDYISLHQ